MTRDTQKCLFVLSRESDGDVILDESLTRLGVADFHLDAFPVRERSNII